MTECKKPGLRINDSDVPPCSIPLKTSESPVSELAGQPPELVADDSLCHCVVELIAEVRLTAAKQA